MSPGNHPLFDLRGRCALVTGGAQGLGRAAAEALAMSGAHVAIVDLDESSATEAVQTVRAYGVEGMFVRCDVSEPDEVVSMTNAVMERFGRLDIGVNNAGVTAKGDAEELELSDWNRVLNVDLTGVFLCAQAQARLMKQGPEPGGKIINIASMYGIFAGGNCAYNTAKAGVIQLTRSLAVEWGRFNINVNAISPGWAMTPAMHATSDETRGRMRSLTALGYLQRARDIQGAIIYLSSEASDYVTGHNLVIDGGHTLNGWLRSPERALPPRLSPDEEVLDAGDQVQGGSPVPLRNTDAADSKAR